jgi:uncharacterized Fe-S center protein
MKSKVYFIRGQGNEGAEVLSAKAEQVFLKLGILEKIEPEAFVALKIHFGEKGNSGHIKPSWLRGILTQLKGKTSRYFITDSNTLYLGKRSNAVDHIHLAWQHGFTPENLEGAPVVIADGLIGTDGEEVKAKFEKIKSPKIGSAIVHSDFLLCLTHMTGHLATGIGGAIKNLGMGCAARAGKLDQHAELHPRVSSKICINCGICLDYCPPQAIFQGEGCVIIDDKKCIGCGECVAVCKAGAIKWRWDDDSVRVQEKMAEYAAAVRGLFKQKAGFVNFLIKITKDCDCLSKDQPPIVEDIGILASSDPVAVDMASVDLVLKRAGRDIFRAGYDIDWSIQLRHGEHVGLGRLDYELIDLSAG